MMVVFRPRRSPARITRDHIIPPVSEFIEVAPQEQPNKRRWTHAEKRAYAERRRLEARGVDKWIAQLAVANAPDLNHEERDKQIRDLEFTHERGIKIDMV